MPFESVKHFFNKLVSGMNNFFKGNIGAMEQSNYDSIISTEMSNAIELWMRMYKNEVSWREKDKKSLGLPAAIASELARLVTLEMQVNIIGPVKAAPTGEKQGKPQTTETVEFLKKQLEPLLENMRQYCEYACAGGGIMFKPYISEGKVAIDCVQATDFKPVAFDSNHRLTSCYFVEHKKKKEYYYHRVEFHQYTKEKYIVTNKAFRSYSLTDTGTEVPLTEVEEWAQLVPEQEIKGLDRPLFSYFRIPMGNIIDPNSPLGVSVYSRAITLIEDADRQYQRYMWEFEGGELAIDAPDDLFKKDKKGEPKLPEGRERLYRTYSLDGDMPNDWLKTFAPTLRETDIGKGLNKILQQIEFNVGLAYGTLSDPACVEKTATEIISSRQRSYSTVSDIQLSLQKALEDLIYIIYAYAVLYELCTQGEYETSFIWDDSIVVDTEAERTRDLNEVRQGLMQKWEYRVKWYGEDEETAKKVLADAAAEKEKEINSFGLA